MSERQLEENTEVVCVDNLGDREYRWAGHVLECGPELYRAVVQLRELTALVRTTTEMMRNLDDAVGSLARLGVLTPIPEAGATPRELFGDPGNGSWGCME